MPDDDAHRCGTATPGQSPGAPGARPAPNPAFLLMALGRLVRNDVEATLRYHDLTLRHVSALGHLATDPGLSYSELGRRAGVTAQSIQATLHQLERRGAVRKRTSPGRGRTAQLHLTPIGEQLLQHGQSAIDQAAHHLLGDLSENQRAELASLLFQAFTATMDGTSTLRQRPTAGSEGSIS